MPQRGQSPYEAQEELEAYRAGWLARSPVKK